MRNTYRIADLSLPLRWAEVLLAFRALLFVGTKYTCPCCGWRVRAFTKAIPKGMARLGGEIKPEAKTKIIDLDSGEIRYFGPRLKDAQDQ